MKNKKIYLIIVFVLLFVVLCSFSVNAENNKVTIVATPLIGTSFEIEGEITWKEYIQNNKPDKFTYTSDGVYWNEYRISIDQSKNYVSPNDVIELTHYYALSECNKSHTYTSTLFAGTWLCETRYFRNTCSICGYQYFETVEPQLEHSYGLDLNTYISPTCTSLGYARYICRNCGAFKEEETLPINPEGHITVGATCIEAGICSKCGEITTTNPYHHNMSVRSCTEGEVCQDCGKLGKDALGHDLNVLGKCQRDGCSYSKVSTWWKGNVSEPVNNGIENFKDWIDEKKENVTNTGDDIKQAFKTFILIIFGAFIIVVLVTILPLVIKFFDFLSDRKNKRGGKK